MDPRLSASDASFLYMETASGPMHVASIHVLEGELAFTAPGIEVVEDVGHLDARHAVDHGVMGLLQNQRLSGHAADRPPPDAPWDPEPVPGPPERLGDALRNNLNLARPSRALEMFAGGERRRHLLALAGRVLSQFFTRPVITAPFNAGMVGPRRRVRFLKKSFGEIREIRRALGGTINDVVLAVGRKPWPGV